MRAKRLRTEALTAQAARLGEGTARTVRNAERAKKLALRENKKLAKEVTQWVETAQGKFTENGGDAGDCAQQ